MIHFLPQLLVIVFFAIRLAVSFQRIRYNSALDTSEKVGHLLGTLLYYGIANLILAWGGFYNVFQQ